MKLSVFTVSTPDLTPEELVQAAREAGLHGVEWRYKEIPADAAGEAPSYWRNNLCSIDPSLPDDKLLRFKHLTEDAGLEMVSVTPYLNHLGLEETEQAFHAARLLGAKLIRVGTAGYGDGTSYPELYDKTVRYLKEAERLAKQYGVKGVVESHHFTIAPSAGLAHRLVSHCDPDFIGVLFDPGNMVYEGYEQFKMGLELLGPYLAHVHIKNAAWMETGKRKDGTAEWRCEWAPLHNGAVDFGRLLADLKSVHYDGYLGIEDFSGTWNSGTMLRQFAQFIHERI
ncbi:sugar phosphate isomerase/epimerase [Fontibacillus phaseoli]|uniref:Sugar phosphate isomerase/epimerase n=1 Tax=Fontibacillus phaseoli TaxID=1416533 RepID=A0A369BAR1_9BACL|nr:sugar phosphate isomerase/epimerase [Fontibacillus phaseoli]RCX18612.1 sugar phosphate isomerase/epimerase [Fontibacillus phaseoli]